MIEKITSSYLHSLQAIYNRIGNRGICVDPLRLKEAKIFVNEEIKKNLEIATTQWNCTVYLGAENDDGSEGSVNINANNGQRTLVKKMQELGYEIPKITKKDSEGNYDQKFSSSELALQKILVKNQFNYAGGDPAIRAILKIRELGKIKSSYLNARLYKTPDDLLLYLSSYNVAGTVTGRRSSKKHTFGFGNNAQNFPKHGSIAKTFRRCLVARPGGIFLMVDQKGAEEWPVLALSGNTSALTELQTGLNRHLKRAAFLFGLDLSVKSEGEWKDGMEYYLGKKCGHAKNYGMRGNRMSDSLAQEGFSINPTMCQHLLDKLTAFDPSTENVFHKYIQEQLYKSRVLETPAGRQRQFLGLRPNDTNYSILNEAYAYVPQSTVGDNTGFAVFHLENNSARDTSFIVQEGHDSIVQDLPHSSDRIWTALEHTIRAFEREFVFYNGIRINIPIEAEIGFDFATTVKIKDLSYAGVCEALEKVVKLREQEMDEKREEIINA